MVSSQTRVRQHGVTLIELMIVIVLIGIFAGMATPAMSHFIKNQRVKSDLQTLSSAMYFAHTEAIRLNTPVYVAPAKIKKDGKINGVASTWDSADAVLVYVDKDRDNAYDSGEDLRISSLSKNTKIAVEARKFTKLSEGFSNPKQFIFLSSGLMRIIDNSNSRKIGYVGRITIADKHDSKKFCRVARVDSNGRSTIGKRNDSVTFYQCNK